MVSTCSMGYDHECFSHVYNNASKQQCYSFSESVNHDKNALFICSACGKKLRSVCMRKSKYGGQLRLCVLINSLNILFILFLLTAFPFFFDTITANRSCSREFLLKITFKKELLHFFPVENNKEISFSPDKICFFLSVFAKDKILIENNYFSSEAVNFFRPLALLALMTFLPPADADLLRKPWVLILFLFDG
jgi:hypothetical protein